jgi:hypothetical protein
MSEVETNVVPVVPKKKNSGPSMTIIILLFIGLAAMAFLWSRKNSALNECTNTNNKLNSDIAAMNKMMAGYVGEMSNDLKTDFTNMLATYDAMEATSQEQADSIEFQKDKIRTLIADLESSEKKNKWTAYQLFEVKKENETMRKIMRGYIVQIDSLNTLNMKLNTDLDHTTNQLNTTASERDAFRNKAEESAAQVRKGSKLQAFSFESGGLRMKLNNTTETTTRARGCVQIYSSFTVSENPLTKAEKKLVYMQVIDPDGKTLQSRSSNVLQTDGGTIAYSDKKEIDYKNEQLDMTVYYDLQSQDVLKGNYKIKIYCDGALIGSDSFTLK